MNQLPEEVQEKISRVHEVNRQIRTAYKQRLRLEEERQKVNDSLEGLRNVGNEEAHQKVGKMFVKRSRDTILNDLEERKEQLNRQIEALSKHGENLEDEFESAKEELTKSLEEHHPSSNQ